jgi:hypothetical protein
MVFTEWDTSNNITYTPVKFRKCNVDDFGINGSPGKYYDVNQGMANLLKPHIDKLQCVDEKLKLYGNYNTVAARVFLFAFTPCAGNLTTSVCKSP